MDVELKTGSLTLNIDNLDENLKLNDLLAYGSRNNKKRGFLFVSKVLGKHYPSDPREMKRIYDLLAKKIYQLNSRADLFIGMAETATGLGQGVYESYYELSKNGIYTNTTRYFLKDYDQVTFKEEHSHATNQIIYKSKIFKKEFMNGKHLVLIDDEVSTGNTFKNLVDTFIDSGVEVESVVFVSILNFGHKEKLKQLKNSMNIPVDFISLCDGEFTFSPSEYKYVNIENSESNSEAKNNKLCLNLGRTGVNKPLDLDFSCLKNLVFSNTDKVLVLGTGEFMHPSFLIAEYFIKKGVENTVVQSTSRSPILLDADIKESLSFDDNYGDGIKNYLYNVNKNNYDSIFIVHETTKDKSLVFLANLLSAVTLQVDDNGTISFS